MILIVHKGSRSSVKDSVLLPTQVPDPGERVGERVSVTGAVGARAEHPTGASAGVGGYPYSNTHTNDPKCLLNKDLQ